MKNLLAGFILLMASTTATAQGVYEGTWVTTNRPLDGTMTCVVTQRDNNNWSGHFFGVWEGVKFSYKVDFTGPPEQLRGKAVIDGARYQWTGALDRRNGSFQASYGGDRYIGSFKLKAKNP